MVDVDLKNAGKDMNGEFAAEDDVLITKYPRTCNWKAYILGLIAFFVPVCMCIYLSLL